MSNDMNPRAKARLERDMANLREQMKKLGKQLEKEHGMKDFDPLKNMNPHYPFNILPDKNHKLDEKSNNPFGPGFPFNHSPNPFTNQNSSFQQSTPYDTGQPPKTQNHFNPTHTGGATVEEFFENEKEKEKENEKEKEKTWTTHEPELYMEDDPELYQEYKYDPKSDNDSHTSRGKPVFNENICEYSIKK